MGKNDYIVASKNDIRTLSKVLLKALNGSITWSDIDTLEDSISMDIFDIIASEFHKGIEL